MSIFKKKKESRFTAFLNRLPFRRKENLISRYSVHFHNLTQFAGALNDNIFKYLIVFLLISLKGVEASSQILFWIGIVYVLPFLLFSSAAGVLADRFSKQRIILLLKIVEVVIIFLGFFAFAFQSPWACYTLMFLLSTQSALFGPSKYGIIPELVEKKAISRANGQITSCTYLAIILGTFLAAAVWQFTEKSIWLSVGVCLVIAVIGFIASLFISYTKPKGAQKKINPLFIYEIYDTLRSTSLRPHLFVSLFGSAFFFFIGAFVQLNIIPFAIEALGMEAEGGSYLFLVTAIGIAIGAYLAGRMCKKRVELGFTPIAGLGMGVLFILLDYRAHHLAEVVTILFFMGMLGGLFVVPFDSYIQTNSPEKKRGQIIAAGNFLSFVGVALAPIAIYIFGVFFGLSTPATFFTVGWIILFITIIITMGLGRLSYHFLSRYFLAPFFNISSVHPPYEEDSEPMVLFLPHYSRLRTYLLMAFSPEMEFYFFKNKKGLFDPLLYFITSYKWVYYQDDLAYPTKQLLESDMIRSQPGAVSVVAFHKLKEKEALKMEPFFKKIDHTYRKVDIKFSPVQDFRWTRFWKLFDAVITYSA